MDSLKKKELKEKIEKVIKESIPDEEVLSMQELENTEGGEECIFGCTADCTAGCISGCWWSGTGSY